MNYESWISYRYLSRRKGGFLSFLTFISIAGVALGVLALIVVTGVMTGFANNLREKIIGSSPHIAVEKETGIQDYAEVAGQLTRIEGVMGVSPYVQGNVFLDLEGNALGLVIRGVDPETEGRVTKVKEFLKEGDLAQLDEEGILIGRELARYAGYSLGDQVTIIAPGSGIIGKGWKYTLTIRGIFDTGMVDFDMNLALLHIQKARTIFNLSEQKVSGLGVKLDDPQHAKDVQKKIYDILGYSFLVRTWIDVNRNLFDALFLEKWGLFIVLTMMVLVASFNIISTLIVTVMSKIHDIGILQSIGVPKQSIRNIFTKMGMYIGSTGTLLGLLSGFAVSYILKTYIKVPADIYSINHVPVEIQLFDIFAIVVAALVITYCASIYPAARAARLQPVEALRYE
ncbi:MAG TPA: ABC transporter permease [Candidatus Omnitrophota bacterium]|nr:ABC transporter permease [Candidatus Omnitrophota bacterium]